MKKVLSLILALAVFCSLYPAAFAAGNEDLSMLTYKELLELQSDISAEYKKNHSPSDSQKELVLNATKIEAQRYFAKKGLEISGWAWYDSEYTYTKDWDFYTLQTHLDYKDGNKKSYQAKIYSEVYFQNKKFVLVYLKSDNTVILDNRSGYENILWFNEPEDRINKGTGIDLSKYSAKELIALNNRAERQIEATHTVAGSERNTILGYTKLELEQYLYEKNYELRGYAWYDSEYTYIRDWDYYWLETHVDYKTNSGLSKTDKLFSEFCKIDGELEIVFLKMGNAVIIDRKNEVTSTNANGIPRYSWAGSTDTKSINESVANVQIPVTSLQVGSEVIDLGVGETMKIDVTVQPNDATNPMLKWESSSSSIAFVSADGIIAGKSQGTVVITASTTDGSEKQVAITVNITKKDDRGKTLTNFDGVELTVLSIKQTKGSDYFQADAGKIFVLIELQIENKSSKEISINSTFGFDAICDNCIVDYSMNADINTDNGFSSTDLKPGRIIKGWKGFEVPQDWKELIVTFTPDVSLFGGGEEIEFVIFNEGK